MGFGAQAAAPVAPDPFSPAALQMRKDEYKFQTQQARMEQTFQRDLAREDREFMESLEERKALRKRKEEEARIKELQDQQEESVDEAFAQQDALAADPEQAFTNMFSSLAKGLSSGSYTEFTT
mgnify:CR=1 FL=1|tara:strand:+ start:1383 stop:1751 length:369 start_codon:yes stop_codon:yes gene_type:complete